LTAAIAIIALLAVIIMPAMRGIMAKADETRCASNLRQIGLAMGTYAAEHDNRLPGPLYTRQGSYYGTRDSYALPMLLAPYLGLPTNVSFEKAKLFECPAWRKMVKGDGGKVYAIQTAALCTDGTQKQPFGYPATSQYAEKPVVPLVALASLSKTPALWDLDALNGGPSDGTVPAKPAHGQRRNTLFFDWHVESVPVP
jgi:prepilin-type processing-associated H-X9-DG protein